MPNLIPGYGKIQNHLGQFVVGVGDNQNPQSPWSLGVLEYWSNDESSIAYHSIAPLLHYSSGANEARRLLPSIRILTSNRVIQ
jgi:hypothetical protein